ncbi:MAG TPA: family 20 glycosylhydrolase [Streptomyces sp.]|nr:family 20 glycosylhydrolase [Streptomyces sp.]
MEQNERCAECNATPFVPRRAATPVHDREGACPTWTWFPSPHSVVAELGPEDRLLRVSADGVDLRAVHKLNVLHLHLTDDQGRRLEVERFPGLTRTGAWRRRPLLARVRRGNRRRAGGT